MEFTICTSIYKGNAKNKFYPNKVEIDVAKPNEAKQVSIKFAIGFAWGGVFGHENPIVHYNKLEKADALSDANTNIAKLNQLKNVQFTLSFTVSAE